MVMVMRRVKRAVEIVLMRFERFGDKARRASLSVRYEIEKGLRAV